MARSQTSEQLQGVFGALLGGMIASFIAMVVFTLGVGQTGSSSSSFPLVAVGIGLACAVALMVGGLYVTDRLSWLASTLLFASGFTTIWSVAVSIGAEPRWISLVALGVAIATGVTAGLRRFGGPVQKVEPVIPDEVAL
jgi:hypothetical protein